MDISHEGEMDPDLALAMRLQEEENANAAASAAAQQHTGPPGSLYEELLKQEVRKRLFAPLVPRFWLLAVF